MHRETDATPTDGPNPAIRTATEKDIDALRSICLKTGFYGRDASHLFHHPQMIGNYCVLPYFYFDREFCLVLELGGAAAGYCVGTPVSLEFFRWMESRWLPRLRVRYPKNTATKSPQEAQVLEEIHRSAVPPQASWLESFPAHLHINLLPRAQGAGWGKGLVHALARRLAEAGAVGVHLSIWRQNLAADGFYRAIGFRELQETESGRTFGMSLADYR